MCLLPQKPSDRYPRNDTTTLTWILFTFDTASSLAWGDGNLLTRTIRAPSLAALSALSLLGATSNRSCIQQTDLTEHLELFRSRIGPSRADPLRHGTGDKLFDYHIAKSLSRCSDATRKLERPVGWRKGARAYAINGCKRAYSQHTTNEMQMVACWVSAGMRLLHPATLI